MLIQSLKFQGMWSSEKEISYADFGQHNLIIGKNNVGKSKLLSAIKFVQQHRPTLISEQGFIPDPESIYDSGETPPSTNTSFVMVVKADDAELLAARTAAEQTNHPQVTYARVYFDSIAIAAEGTGRQVSGRVSAVGVTGKDTPTDPARNYVAHTKNAIFESFCSHVHLVGGKRSLREPADSGFSIMQLLHRWRDPPQKEKHLFHKFQQIQRLFRDLMRNSDVELRPQHDGSNLHLSMGGRYLPIDSFGDGIHHLLIIAYYMTIDPKAILLLEEPETHLLKLREQQVDG